MYYTSRQIILRDWQKADFLLYKKWHQGKHRWMDFNGPYFPQKSIETIETELLHVQTESEAPCKHRMVIAEKSKNQLIGTVSWYWQSIETQWLSLGLAIYEEAYWGKGIGYEALGLWVTHIFTVFPQIIRLDLRTWSGNVGMMRVAEKLGFTLEARFRKARIVEGVYFDSIGYGILRAEWEHLHPNGFVP